MINVVFFTVKTKNGLEVVDDMCRRYGVFNTATEAKEKIQELNKIVTSN